MANMWFAAWFSTVTCFIPTPDYWQIWCEKSFDKSNLLPNIPGI